MSEAITIQESKRLIELEKVVATGKTAWRTAGEALIEIRDQQLYRAEHETFWEYCEKRWGWKKRNAHYLIEAAAAIKALPEGVQNFAQSASQARELAKAEPEKRAQVVETAAAKAEAESRPMTAKDVKEAVLEVCPPQPNQREDSEPETKDTTPTEPANTPAAGSDHKKLARHLEDITCQLQNWMAIAGAASEKEKLCIRPVALVLKTKALAVFEWAKKTS